VRKFGARATAARVAVIDGYQFPEAVADRFRREHPELHPEETGLVEAAARQWFRLIAREPKRSLALPSRAVSDLWLAFLHAEGSYRHFCTEALGVFLPHLPPPSGPGEGVAGGPSLLRTLESALRDEPDPPQGLPWLFRVDGKTQILNARRYILTCGGGPECYPVAGSICLHHLAGSDRVSPDPDTAKRAKQGPHADWNNWQAKGGWDRR
jgi:hypothetical protein